MSDLAHISPAASPAPDRIADCGRPLWAMVRRDWETGRSARAVADHYGLTHAAVRSKAQREDWTRPEPEAPARSLVEHEAALEAELAAAPPPPASELMDQAWAQAARAVRMGRAAEAKRWLAVRDALEYRAMAEADRAELESRVRARVETDAQRQRSERRERLNEYRAEMSDHDFAALCHRYGYTPDGDIRGEDFDASIASEASRHLAAWLKPRDSFEDLLARVVAGPRGVRRSALTGSALARTQARTQAAASVQKPRWAMRGE